MRENFKDRIKALKQRLDPFEPVPICISDVEVGSDEYKRILSQFNAGSLRCLPIFVVDAS